MTSRQRLDGETDRADDDPEAHRDGCGRPVGGRMSSTCPGCRSRTRTVGRTFTAPDGTTYRPSMFVTLTLGSYGRDRARATGRHRRGRSRYDYRRAAVEAMFFPRLFDRWMQNLRRCAGYRVQYFGAIEPQRRLAPHIHLAIRGAIPREVIRTVTRATYLQLWWPSFDEPVYVDDDAGLGRRDRAPTWTRRPASRCRPGRRRSTSSTPIRTRSRRW